MAFSAGTAVVELYIRAAIFQFSSLHSVAFSAIHWLGLPGLRLVMAGLTFGSVDCCDAEQ